MSAHRPAAVTVLYDDDCGFCKVSVAVLLRWDRRGLIYPAPIQGREGEDLLAAMAPAERLQSAHLVTAEGTLLSGGEAAPALFRQLPGGRPLAALSAAAMPVTKLAYRLLTRLRSVIGPALPVAWRRGAERMIEDRRQGTMPPTTAR